MDNDTMRKMGFDKEIDRKESGCCPLCAHPISKEEFKDDLSRKEYIISGLCQDCQDKAFREVE